MHGPLSHIERPELVDRRDLSLLVDRRKERGESRRERREREKGESRRERRERGEILLSSVLQQASQPLMQLKRKVVVL